MESRPPPLGVQSFSHWTTREALEKGIFKLRPEGLQRLRKRMFQVKGTAYENASKQQRTWHHGVVGAVAPSTRTAMTLPKNRSSEGISNPKQIRAEDHREPGAQQAVNLSIQILTLLGSQRHFSVSLAHFSQKQRFLNPPVGGVWAELWPTPEVDSASELGGRFEQQNLLCERKGKFTS